MKAIRKINMVDIETTGTKRDGSDDILEIAVVELDQLENGFWVISGKKPYHCVLHNDRQPETIFAKEHMAKLYKLCNEQDHRIDLYHARDGLCRWLHGPDWDDDMVKYMEPKFFMGWNASNFDLEFLFDKKVLDRSYYVVKDGKEMLVGDAHYRVYEQTGAIEFLMDVTGLDRKIILDLALAMCPESLKLPVKGISHNALDDCYYQVNMMNGLIALGKSGFKLSSTVKL